MRPVEIHVVLAEAHAAPGPHRLLAYVTVVLEGEIGRLAVHDIKVVEGRDGPFVAMPARRLTGHCQVCRGKNCLTAGWCNWCGVELVMRPVPCRPGGRPKVHADVIHPIDVTTRDNLEVAVLTEYFRVKN